MWPFIRLTGFSQRVLSGECHWTIISKSPATPFLSGGNCPNARNITPMVNSHPPCVRGFMRMRESTRLTSSLYSTPSHAMLWAGITVLQKCSSEIPSPHLATEESRAGKAYVLSFSTESKTASGPEKTVEGETSTYLQRWQSSKSTTALPCRMWCHYLT